MAEGTGFEPAVACATTVFKTVTFSHSVTPPRTPEIVGKFPATISYYTVKQHNFL